MTGHDWILVGVGLMAFVALCRSHGKNDIILGKCPHCGGFVMPQSTPDYCKPYPPRCTRCRAFLEITFTPEERRKESR